MKYVDGFVFVITKKNLAAYRTMAKEGGRMWKKFGALDYIEAIGDDLNPNMGGPAGLTFANMTKAKRGETVWFSFITFKSRKHRDQVNAKVMKAMNDPKEQAKWKGKSMPLDMKRMAYGGFAAQVDL